MLLIVMNILKFYHFLKYRIFRTDNWNRNVNGDWDRISTRVLTMTIKFTQQNQLHCAINANVRHSAQDQMLRSTESQTKV